MVGGVLGVLMMIPLRRSLIVQEHANLPYPEGTACASVLIAGEKGGNLARTAYMGLGVAVVYAFLQRVLRVIAETPALAFKQTNRYLPAAVISGDITPEYLGVGYIIGPRIAGVLVAGGVLAWLGLIPLHHGADAGRPDRRAAGEARLPRERGHARAARAAGTPPRTRSPTRPPPSTAPTCARSAPARSPRAASSRCSRRCRRSSRRSSESLASLRRRDAGAAPGAAHRARPADHVRARRLAGAGAGHRGAAVRARRRRSAASCCSAC